MRFSEPYYLKFNGNISSPHKAFCKNVSFFQSLLIVRICVVIARKIRYRLEMLSKRFPRDEICALSQFAHLQKYNRRAQSASESQPKLFRGLFADKARFTLHSNDAIHFIVRAAQWSCFANQGK